MKNKDYAEINALKLALSTGIVGAIFVFLTTLLGIFGYSNAAGAFASTVWGSLGYSVTLAGSFVGAILGFVYAFVLIWIIIMLYNKFLSN